MSERPQLLRAKMKPSTNPGKARVTRRKAVAPPRRKSCVACVAAKRRCDLRQPACSRCDRQKLECCYPTAPPCPSPSPGGNSGSPGASNLLDFGQALNDTSTLAYPALDAADFGMMPEATFSAVDDLLNPGDNSFALGTLLSLQSLPVPITPLFVLPSFDSTITSRLEYSIRQLKLAPEAFVRGNQTPWSHRHLYDEKMPRCIQGPYAHRHLASYIG
jgi:Fungal Zn(2)-Cys(6) binuclear cluster domain